MDLSRLLPRFVILLGSSHFTWRRYRGSARRQPRRHLLDAGQTSVVLDPERGDRVLVRVTDVVVLAVRAQGRVGRAAARGFLLAVEQNERPVGFDPVARDRTVVPEASRVSEAVVGGDDALTGVGLPVAYPRAQGRERTVALDLVRCGTSLGGGYPNVLGRDELVTLGERERSSSCRPRPCSP